MNTKRSDLTLARFRQELAATMIVVCFSVPTFGADLQYQQLKSLTGLDGYQPHGPLLEGSDRMLYGTAWFGGSNSAGTVFRLNKDGTDVVVLHHFGSGAGDGKNPMSGLIEGSDGVLYGTTQGGGTNRTYVGGDGTAFKLNKDGSGYSILYKFGSATNDGVAPVAGLLQGSDGALYGTTFAGNYGATIFKLNTNGGGYTILHRAGDIANDGVGSQSALVKGNDGTLYGTSWTGGSNNLGTVFKLNQDGSAYAVLHHFVGSLFGGEPQFPTALILASDGILYGSTYYGGDAGVGTLFKLNTNGSGFTVIHSFTTNLAEGWYPSRTLLEASDGALYGTTYGDDLVTGDGDVAYKLNKDGSGFAVLHRFGSVSGDGKFPVAGLIQASDGALYGTTSAGGAFDSGAIFKLSWPLVITQYERNGTNSLLSWSGVPKWPYRIQTRTNLTEAADAWVTLGGTNSTGPDGTIQITVPEPPNTPARFYRIVWP